MAKDGKGKAAVRGAENAPTDSPSRKDDAKRKRPAASGSKPSTSSSSSSRSHSQRANKKQRFDKPQQQKAPGSASSVPGASKLKSSIRQTKRLLAKDNLAPGTRIEAERRLKSLESDLELSSRKNVEKSRASRYHRVKFVERQKLVRRIARCKRNLARLDKPDAEEAADDSDSDSEGESEGTQLSKGELLDQLKWLRQLLQYVVQYPADLRYVALFPNAEEGPVAPNAKEEDKSRKKAYEHLERVKKAIKDGELGQEPEVELSSKDRPRTKLASSSSNSRAAVESNANGSARGKAVKKQSKSSTTKHQQQEAQSDDDGDSEAAHGVKGDDFFAQSSDEED